jgi:chemosensory pili system protein ChpE
VDRVLWTAFVLGIAFSAPPGPVNAEAVRRGLHRGFWGAFLTEVGALVGDAAWAILALSGAALLATRGRASMPLGVLGVLLLFVLGGSALRDAWIGRMPHAQNISTRADFLAGALISLSNPFAIAFWLGLSGVASSLAPGHQSTPLFVLFLAAFLLGAFVWCCIMAVTIAWGRRHLPAGFYRWISAASGCALVWFGAQLLIHVLRDAGVLAGR